MSSLLKTYANNCGVKVTEKPTFPECFFPSPENYITVHNGSGMDSKNYDFYSEVIYLIRQYSDLDVIQIGDKNEPMVETALQYQGVTTMRQCAYLVKNAKLHIGNDSVWMHYAGSVNTPTVALFGPTIPKVTQPSFRGLLTCLEGDRGGKQASCRPFESPKTINTIKPETVAVAALDLLGIKHDLSVETFFIGKNYHKDVIQIVPDQIVPPNAFPNQLLNVKMDYHFNETNLYHILKNYPCGVSTEKAINVEILKASKKNLHKVFYKFGDDLDVEFVKSLHYAGIPYSLIYDGGSEEQLRKYRIELFDFKEITKHEEKSIKDIPDFEKLDRNFYFKTNKFVLSNGKIFLSKFHWERGINIVETAQNAQLLGEALDEKSFWQDLDFLYIFSKK